MGNWICINKRTQEARILVMKETKQEIQSQNLPIRQDYAHVLISSAEIQQKSLMHVLYLSTSHSTFNS